MAGALSYGELAAALPRSGGEYHFLGRIYHPVLGFVAGWISVTVGFAAPSALAAMALGEYAATFTSLSPQQVAVVTIVVIAVFHGINVRLGRHFHLATTALKLTLIIAFCSAGLLVPQVGGTDFAPSLAGWQEVFSPAFSRPPVAEPPVVQ